MVRAARIIDWVLDKLESGQTNGIEGCVVGAPGVGQAERFGFQIGKGLEPATEHGTHRVVALHINTTNFARAVIQVKVSGEVLVILLPGERPAWSGIGGGGVSFGNVG